MSTLRVTRVDTTARRGGAKRKKYVEVEIAAVSPAVDDPFASLWMRSKGLFKRFVDVELSCGHVMRVTECRLKQMRENVSGTVRCEWCQTGEDNQ